MAIVDLSIAGSVANASQLIDSYVPANGAKITIIDFEGSCITDSTVNLQLEWDGTDIWYLRGNSSITLNHAISDADGIKILKLIGDNPSAAATTLSGRAKIKVM